MMNHGVSRYAITAVCGMLCGCGQNSSLPVPSADTMQQQSQSPDGSRAATADLSVKAEFDRVAGVPTIEWRKPFRVTLTNASKSPLRIWNSKTRAGYYQFSVHFTDAKTGEKHIAKRRIIDDDGFFRALAQGMEPGTEQIVIAPAETFVTQIDLGDFAWGQEAWLDLPDPNTSSPYQVTIQFECSNEAPANQPQIWTGRSASEPASAQFTASGVTTPLDYLRHGFPTAAIRLMAADLKLINSRDTDDCTPLHIAAQHGHVPVVKWLLDHGADVNTVAGENTVPLHLATEPEVIELLLGAKPKLDFASDDETPLQRATEQLKAATDDLDRVKWRRIVDAYLKAGAEVDAITAIRLGHLARLKTILSESPKIADDFKKSSLLRKAASSGRLQICEYLIKNFRVDVNDFDRGNGYPILMDALKYPGIVKLLLENGADIKKRITWQGGRSGWWLIGEDATLLHHAADFGVPETCQLLLDHGVDPLATDDRGQVALYIAAFFGRTENAAVIIQHPTFKKAPAELRQPLLDKFLMIGARTFRMDRSPQRLKLFPLLIEQGANPNFKENGATPIMQAASAIHPDSHERNEDIRQTVAYLMEHGAQLDLFSAVAIGDLKQVRRLLASDPQSAAARSPDGYPALHFAVGMDYREIVATLLKAGCDVDIRNQSEHTGSANGTALHNAAFWGRLEIARMLIDAGADINAKAGKFAVTPLDEAHRLEKQKVARLLLQHGATSNDQRKQ